MTIPVKWEPFQDITRFFEEVDKLFENFLKSFSEELYAIKTSGGDFKVDIKDSGDELVITGEIPGNVSDNVDVVVHKDAVVIVGENAWENNAGNNNEYHWTKFTRACSLPVRVKSEAAQVEVKNGKIKIKVPKA